MNSVLRRKKSIRFRLTAWYAGILTLAFAIAGAWALFEVWDAAKETIDKDLRVRLASVRAYLTKHSGAHAVSELVDDFEEEVSLAPGGAWLQLADTHGHWIYRSPAIVEESAAPPSADNLPVRGRAQAVTVKGRPLRVLTAAVPGGVVQIATPMDEFAEMYRGLTWGLALASPLLLALASAGGYWMSGRALKPINEIASRVTTIGARNLSERLVLRGTDDELDRLSRVLNQMLGRLQSAFQLVTQFTADASHELRTPVGIVLTTAEVIRSRRRSAEEHEAAWDQVILQSQRMTGLIDDLLVLARADAGRSELTVVPMDLAAVLGALIEEVRILAERSGIRLRASLIPDCPMSADPDAIRRLFLVLLDNAIKYTPREGEICVEMRTADAFGHLAAIVEIHDTGPGIEPQHLPHIFDRFYRVSADRSRNTGGAGLGLAIAQWLASLHHGEIVVDSVVGAGSTFRVTLPVQKTSLRDSAIFQNRSS